MNKILKISIIGLLIISLGIFILPNSIAKALPVSNTSSGSTHNPGCYNLNKTSQKTCNTNAVDQAGNKLSSKDSSGSTLSSINCYILKSSTNPTVYNQVECSNLTTLITPTNNTSNTNQDPNVACADEGGALSWIVCPVIKAIGDGETLFVNMINTQLKTKPVNFTNKNDPIVNKTMTIWSNFRIIGNLILVIAILVIVYAEAVGGSIADAYTVQKTLPRLLLTAIFINLSVYILLGLEDIFNILGSGISGILLSPFQGASTGGGLISISSGTSAIFDVSAVGIGLISLGLLTSGIVELVLLLSISGIIALIGVFVTVILRQGVLFLLVVTSPVGFALYCLPNTEQYFKKWWNFLIKTLMVYPIVSTLIALAYISGFVMSQINGGTEGQLLAIVASMLPLFIIPFAFKLSGGIMSSIYGAVSGVTNRVRSPINKFASKRAKGKASENMSRLRNSNYFKGGNDSNRRGKFNKRLQRATFATQGGFTLNSEKRKARIDQAVNDHNERNLEEIMKQNPEIQTIMGNGEFSKLAMESANDQEFTEKLLSTKTYRDMKEARIEELKATGLTQDQADKQADSELRTQAQNRSQRFFTAKRKIGNTAFKEVMAQSYFSDKNAPNDVEDALKVMADMADSIGNDPASQEAYIMKVSSMMDKVGRVDFSAASAGTKLSEGMKIITAKKNGAKDDEIKKLIEDSAEKIRISSLESTSGSKAMMQASPRALEQLSDQQNRNLGNLRMQMSNTTDPNEMANLQREFKRQYASIAANYDALASTDPAHAKIYADRIMGQSAIGIDGEDLRMNNQQYLDKLRNDPEFLQFRREYSSRQEAERSDLIQPPTT